MHRCEEFREQMAEQVIGGEDPAVNLDVQREMLICSACSEFYMESREMIEALSALDRSISEQQWDAIEYRLRMRILQASPSASGRRRRQAPGEGGKSMQMLRRSPYPLFRLRPIGLALRVPEGEGDFVGHRAPLQLLAAAALVLITVGLYQLMTPAINTEKTTGARTPQAVYVDHNITLDPVTIDFLDESELLLRDVLKITPNDAEDLADAKKLANSQLADIQQRKEAAADVPPVVDVMETYESVLRDIRNLDERSVAEDIADIQSRIRKNGLIANIKVFQPNINPVSFDIR